MVNVNGFFPHMVSGGETAFDTYRIIVDKSLDENEGSGVHIGEFEIYSNEDGENIITTPADRSSCFATSEHPPLPSIRAMEYAFNGRERNPEHSITGWVSSNEGHDPDLRHIGIELPTPVTPHHFVVVGSTAADFRFPRIFEIQGRNGGYSEGGWETLATVCEPLGYQFNGLYSHDVNSGHLYCPRFAVYPNGSPSTGHYRFFLWDFTESFGTNHIQLGQLDLMDGVTSKLTGKVENRNTWGSRFTHANAYPDKLFDGDSSVRCVIEATSSTGHFVAVEIPYSDRFEPTSFKITTHSDRSRDPKSFNFYGSYDGVYWELLKSVVDEPAWTNYETREYTI